MTPKLSVGLATIVLGVALDQGSKALAARSIAYGEHVAVIDGFFSLTHLRNSAASFGLFSSGDPALRNGVFIAASLAGIALGVHFFRRIAGGDRRSALALGLMLGGALGNLIDRVFRGTVVDFLDFGLWGHAWPTFNLADSLIVVGVAGLMLRLFRAEP